jgi:Met-10+ like-protein
MKKPITFLKGLIPARYRPIGYLLHLTRTRSGGRVCAGSFSGVRYVDDSVGSAYIPKLLGIYENELFAEVENICAGKPALIVDIGAAEGYYAVGLAVRNPQAKVIAFEMEPKGRLALKEMSRLNQVSHRVEVRGKCEPSDLAATLGDVANPVVICDVEGYEEKLLDPQAVPALARAAILVELHDFIIPGITEELKRRFGPTHRIKHIWQQPRSRTQFPWQTFGTRLLPKSYLDWSVSEWRPVQMAWLWMEPHG